MYSKVVKKAHLLQASYYVLPVLYFFTSFPWRSSTDNL